MAVAAACLLVRSLGAQQKTPAAPWVSSFGAGIAITSGNTETQNVNFSFASRYDPKTRLVFSSDALYLRGESNGTRQVDKASAGVRLQFGVTDRAFTFSEVSYLRDPFKELTYSIAPVAGVGYHVVRRADVHLNLDLSAGGQMESGPAGRTADGAFKAGETFDWALSKTSKFTQKSTGIWKMEDVRDALYHFDGGLVTTIAGRVDLKLAYVYDYKTRKPSPTVTQGDSALFAALLLKF